MQFPRRGNIETLFRHVDRAAKRPETVVVVHRPAVRTGQHLQRAVVGIHVVEQDADRQDILIGVRVERPVLMPLHRGAVLRRLHVDLAARAQPDVRSDQPFERRHDARIGGKLSIEGVRQMRLLDAANARSVRRMGSLQIQDRRVFGEAGGGRHHVGGDGAQFGQRVRQQCACDDHVAVGFVLLDLGFGEHAIPPPSDEPLDFDRVAYITGHT